MNKKAGGLALLAALVVALLMSAAMPARTVMLSPVSPPYTPLPWRPPPLGWFCCKARLLLCGCLAYTQDHIPYLGIHFRNTD